MEETIFFVWLLMKMLLRIIGKRKTMQKYIQKSELIVF